LLKYILVAFAGLAVAAVERRMTDQPPLNGVRVLEYSQSRITGGPPVAPLSIVWIKYSKRFFLLGLSHRLTGGENRK
jgi:hypothetical protein